MRQCGLIFLCLQLQRQHILPLTGQGILAHTGGMRQVGPGIARAMAEQQIKMLRPLQYQIRCGLTTFNIVACSHVQEARAGLDVAKRAAKAAAAQRDEAVREREALASDKATLGRHLDAANARLAANPPPRSPSKYIVIQQECSAAICSWQL